MKKAMLSQPMAGKTEQEIIETRERAIAALKAQGYAECGGNNLNANRSEFMADWFRNRNVVFVL